MSKPAPLPGVKLRKRRLDNLVMAINKGRLDLSLHKKFNSWQDVHNYFGTNPTDYITVQEGRDAVNVSNYNRLAIELETKLREKLAHEAQQERDGVVIQPAPVITIQEETKKADVSGGDSSNANSLIVHPNNDPANIDLESTHKYDKHPLDDPKYAMWMPECPGQKAVLFPHQRKAAKDIMWKLFVEGRRSVLLRAPVGSGKTFIFGQVLAWLWNMQPKPWFWGKTFSPIPSLVVTKASIVEQTSRVMANLFGLDTVRQTRTLHYDALRSSVGERMIENETVVEDGIPRKSWKWIPGLNPLFYICDECQSAKNQDSQQSQITQSIAKIADSNVKTIFSSATPFTRVSEAKYFVVNSNIPMTLV